MNKMNEVLEMNKMKQTVVNVQVQVLSFSDRNFDRLEIRAVDKFGIELPMNSRTLFEIENDLTTVVENEEPAKEEIEEDNLEEINRISNIYLFANKDETNFLIGSCSPANTDKLEIAVSSIDPTFELSEMMSDEDAKSLDIELDDLSISTVYEIANNTSEPQIITIFNEG